MSDIMTFSFENLSVRTLGDSLNPLFVAGDLAAILGYQSAKDATRFLDEDERTLVEIDTAGGLQKVSAVTESGLYAMILKSRRPEAKRFRKWVTSEVLPAIRKQGYYAGPDYIDEAQQREIQKAVGRRASGAPKNFRVIYSALKDHFRF